MKKILFAFDGTRFPEGAFSFVCELHRLQNLFVAGLFVPQLADYWNFAAGVSGDLVMPLIQEGESHKVKQNIKRFAVQCKKNGIPFKVHEDLEGFALPDLLEESRFADALVLEADAFYGHAGEGVNDYMKETLHRAECPLMVLPEQGAFPDSVVLAYDGSASSVYAIRQFTYVFPELCSLPALLLYVSERKETMPFKAQIKELAAQHFPHLTLESLEVYSKELFATWMEEKRGALLVSGAFGRSGASQLIRKSFVSELLSTHKLPVFIAHR